LRLKVLFRSGSECAPQKVLDDVREQESEVLRIQATLDRKLDSTNFENIPGLMEEVKASLAGLEGLLQATNSTLNLLTQFVEPSVDDAVLKWIPEIKHGEHHNTDEKTALSGTGQWLLEHDTDVARYGCSTPTVLWLRACRYCFFW
jgi:hypothetical protein